MEIPPARAARARRARVAILLPARDEEEGIGRVLQSIPHEALVAMGYDVDVVVVDGSSRDRTRDVARAHGARILRQGGAGKGRGVREALDTIEADYFVMLDADNTYPTEDIPHFLARLANGFDVVMGSRMRGQIHEGAMSAVNVFGNRALSALASMLYFRRVSDVCTGMWAFRQAVVRALPLRSRHFELEAELYALSVRAGLRMTEVPIEYRPRLGRTKLGRVRDGLFIGATLVQKRFTPLTFRVARSRRARAPRPG